MAEKKDAWELWFGILERISQQEDFLMSSQETLDRGKNTELYKKQVKEEFK